MKEVVLQPLVMDGSVIVQFAACNELTKNVFIKVPSQYRAFAFVGEKLSFRVEPCGETCVYKEFGKDHLGKSIKFAFVLAKAFPSMRWGFGNINVNNERLKEAYRVGANGTYVIEVPKFENLISNFAFDKAITVDMIREKSLSALKSVGIPVLADYFAGSKVSIFEVNKDLMEIRKRILDALNGEAIFKNLGILVNSLTVDGIHINEDDLNIIKSRING